MNSFKVSPVLINSILNDTFSIPSGVFANTSIYIGLGIEFDEETFTFTKEPVSPGFTVLPTPVEFSEPINGVIRNKNAIEWPKALEDWTVGDETIKYVGLYYKNDEMESDSASSVGYTLVMVLPLVPEETVHITERMILNAEQICINWINL